LRYIGALVMCQSPRATTSLEPTTIVSTVPPIWPSAWRRPTERHITIMSSSRAGSTYGNDVATMLSASNIVVKPIGSAIPSIVRVPVVSLVDVLDQRLVTESVPAAIVIPFQVPATSAAVRAAGAGGASGVISSGAAFSPHAAASNRAGRSNSERMG